MIINFANYGINYQSKLIPLIMVMETATATPYDTYLLKKEFVLVQPSIIGIYSQVMLVDLTQDTGLIQMKSILEEFPPYLRSIVVEWTNHVLKEGGSSGLIEKKLGGRGVPPTISRLIAGFAVTLSDKSRVQEEKGETQYSPKAIEFFDALRTEDGISHWVEDHPAMPPQDQPLTSLMPNQEELTPQDIWEELIGIIGQDQDFLASQEAQTLIAEAVKAIHADPDSANIYLNSLPDNLIVVAYIFYVGKSLNEQFIEEKIGLFRGFFSSGLKWEMNKLAEELLQYTTGGAKREDSLSNDEKLVRRNLIERIVLRAIQGLREGES